MNDINVNTDADIEQPEPSAPSGETKAEKFKRLATYRVTKAVERIKQIGHLSNASQYEFTEEQVQKINNLLTDTLATTMRKFDKKKGADEPVIDL